MQGCAAFKARYNDLFSADVSYSLLLSMWVSDQNSSGHSKWDFGMIAVPKYLGVVNAP